MKKQDIIKKSLLYVEDNSETRMALLEVLNLFFETVYVASDGCEAEDIIKLKYPDIIISDIKLPCSDGIKLMQNVKNDNYNPIIIFTTAFSEEKFLLEAIDLHVESYLIKPIDITLLIQKIKNALQRDSYFEKDLSYKKLSKREFEVFLDLAKGMKPATIAKKYGLRAKTVSTYRSRIFEKLSFNSNADMITYALRQQLL